ALREIDGAVGARRRPTTSRESEAGSGGQKFAQRAAPRRSDSAGGPIPRNSKTAPRGRKHMTDGCCPSCHQPLLPAEPLYDLQLCAVLIPCSPGALRTFLWRNRVAFPAKYRLVGS